MKVVVVDDSINVRKHLVALLANMPQIEIVGEAKDVREGIETIRRLKPDGVILDISMPDGSGLDVLKFIRKDLPATVVIMLTNYPYPQYRDACFNAGANYFFDKSNEFQCVGEALLSHHGYRPNRGAVA